jgi:DNA-binding CsgD family transcriptional regulator
MIVHGVTVSPRRGQTAVDRSCVKTRKKALGASHCCRRAKVKVKVGGHVLEPRSVGLSNGGYCSMESLESIDNCEQGFDNLIGRVRADVEQVLWQLRATSRLTDALKRENGVTLIRGEAAGLEFALVLGRGSREERLTAREREVAHLIGSGCPTREASARLKIREATVRNHLRQIYVKLGIGSRAALARWHAVGGCFLGSDFEAALLGSAEAPTEG